MTKQNAKIETPAAKGPALCAGRRRPVDMSDIGSDLSCRHPATRGAYCGNHAPKAEVKIVPITPENDEPSRRARRAPKVEGKRKSGVEAAIEFLRRIAPKNATCKDMVSEMRDSGDWTPAGKTPENTLHAALSRYIKKAGDECRIFKAEKGRFALRTSVTK